VQAGPGARKLAVFDAENPAEPVFALTEWRRERLKVTFHRAAKDAVSFEVVPGSAVHVEESDDDADTAPPTMP
jgi:hypothetical protein